MSIDDQALERFRYQILLRSQILEYLPIEHKIAAIYPDVAGADRTNIIHQSIGAYLDLVQAHIRTDGNKAPDCLLLFVKIDQRWQLQITQSITVVGQKRLFVGQVRLNGLQSFANVGCHAGVDERNVPVLNVAGEQLDGRPAVGEHKIVGEILVVIQEIILDDVSLPAEAEDELFVAKVRIVFHDMPENR